MAAAYLSVLSKEIYEELGTQYFSKKTDTMNSRGADNYSTQCILNIVSQLSSSRKKPEKQDDLTSMYETQTDASGKTFLLFKNDIGKHNLKGKKILPYEDSFDILAQAHFKSNHGKEEEMRTVISSTYYISPLSYETILKSCKICNKNAHKFALTKMCVIPMDSDNGFNYILAYVDKKTQYVLLRPLINNDNALELSMELLKIFFSFGVPIHIATLQPVLSKYALKMMDPVFEDIASVNIESDKSLVATKEFIKDKVDSWLKDRQSKNWATCCSAIQLFINTTVIEEIDCSPYKLLFN